MDHAVTVTDATHTPASNALASTNKDTTAIDHYSITKCNIEQVYCSPHCFSHVFQELFEYMGSPIATHPTAGLNLSERGGRVFINTIS